MKTDSQVQNYVRAFLLRERSQAEDALKLIRESDPYRKHCGAIATAWDTWLQYQHGDYRQAVAQLRAALEPLPTRIELLNALLMAGVRLAFGQNRVGEASRLLRLLQSTIPANASSVVLANVLYCRAQVELKLGTGRDVACLSEACALSVPVGSGLWYALRMALVGSALRGMNTGVAEKVMAELKSRPPADSVIGEVCDDLGVWLLTSQGRLREGQKLLDGMPLPGTPAGRALRVERKLELLLAAGRHARVEAVLEAEGDALTPFWREYWRATVCLRKKDIGGLRRHCRQALDVPGLEGPFVSDCARLMAKGALLAGHTREARNLLGLVDRDERDGTLDMLRACLHLLEGDADRAARYFRGILDRKDPDAFRLFLYDADGLHGDQLSCLWTLALDMEPSTASAGGAVSGKAEAVPAHREDSMALVGGSPAMAKVRDNIARFAPLAETVLISGETGTGKELVARLLHERGPRSGEPFIAVNCGGISETLIESEFFGHVKGAFTGAMADHEGLFLAAGKGTIFLDEITSMSPRLQAALLRVLENGEVRPVGANRARKIAARVIAASNRPMNPLAERGEFRPDLYYRLARLHIELPPLRERPEDIRALARHFLGRFYEYREVRVEDDLFRALEGHSWPGNVRELENEMRRMALLAAGQRTLDARLFHQSGGKGAPVDTAPVAVPAPAEAESVAPVVVSQQEPVRVYDRLKMLRRIFADRRELTRADAVRLLGCAPNTATRHLRQLEQEGLIERVHTSASLRTSYFALKERKSP